MYNVKFVNENVDIKVEEGTRVIECIRKAGLRIETKCDEKGSCGKCKVKVEGKLDDKSSEEKKHTKEDSSIRLACMARIMGDVKIEILAKKQDAKVSSMVLPVDIKVNSAVKKIHLPQIEEKGISPYKDIIGYKVKSVNIMKKIAKIKNKSSKLYQGVIFKDKLLDILEESKSIFGVAIDIGTVGISAYLINLENGEVVDKVSCINPQVEHGKDILARINFCRKEKSGIDILSNSIRKSINAIIKALTNQSYEVSQIYRIIVAANTAMLHFLLGVIPDYDENNYFRPIFLDELSFNARELDIDINAEGVLTLMPSSSWEIGADIVGGVIALDFNNKKNCSMFVDIGINSEIAVIKDTNIMANSISTGSVFEGISVSCGLRMEEGAIDSFSIDKNFNVNYSIIGGKKVRGICGSGLIDVIAELKKQNIVSPEGVLLKSLPENVKNRVEDDRFYITEDIYISETDIKQVEKAREAISNGIINFLKYINVKIEEVEEILLTGAFGNHVNINNMKEIGLIPEGFKGKVNFYGNTSLEGARLALINEKKLKDMSIAARSIKFENLYLSNKF